MQFILWKQNLISNSIFSPKNSLLSGGHPVLIEVNVSKSDNTLRLIMTVRTMVKKTELIFLPYKKNNTLKKFANMFCIRKTDRQIFTQSREISSQITVKKITQDP